MAPLRPLTIYETYLLVNRFSQHTMWAVGSASQSAARLLALHVVSRVSRLFSETCANPHLQMTVRDVLLLIMDADGAPSLLRLPVFVTIGALTLMIAPHIRSLLRAPPSERAVLVLLQDSLALQVNTTATVAPPPSRARSAWQTPTLRAGLRAARAARVATLRLPDLPLQLRVFSLRLLLAPQNLRVPLRRPPPVPTSYRQLLSYPVSARL